MSKQRITYDNNVLGQARFADYQELANARLLNNSGGVVFGRINNSLVEKPAEIQGHSLIVGGTGTGKSRGIAIPTLLRWKGAVLAIDVKGELSKLTAQHRPNVHIFDPENEGEPYDPLQECKTIDGAQELARCLIPEPQTGDPFWAKTAQAFLAAGAMQGALEGERFVDVIERLCITQPEQLIENLQNSSHRAVRMLSSVGVGMPEKTMGGVFAELRSKIITLGADPNIEKATSSGSLTPQTLEEGSTIYLKVSEKMLKQYESLWSVIVSQILRYLQSREERSDPPILILLDEFPRLGRMPGILDALATLRSRNVHILIFVQSMAQLDHLYSANERKIIADNCGFKLVLSATDPETQKYFSDLSGQQTVWVGNRGYADGRSTAGAIGIIPGASVNKSQGLSQQGTPLIRPEEFSKLEYPVLFAPGLYPCYVSKSYWDKDPELAPTMGMKPERPEKMKQSIKPKSKINWRIIQVCVSLLAGFVIATFALKYFIGYSISNTSVKSKMTAVEYESAIRASKSILYTVKAVFSTWNNFKTFALIWLGSAWFIFGPSSVLRAIFGRRKN